MKIKLSRNIFHFHFPVSNFLIILEEGTGNYLRTVSGWQVWLTLITIINNNQIQYFQNIEARNLQSNVFSKFPWCDRPRFSENLYYPQTLSMASECNVNVKTEYVMGHHFIRRLKDLFTVCRVVNKVVSQVIYLLCTMHLVGLKVEAICCSKWMQIEHEFGCWFI